MIARSASFPSLRKPLPWLSDADAESADPRRVAVFIDLQNFDNSFREVLGRSVDVFADQPTPVDAGELTREKLPAPYFEALGRYLLNRVGQSLRGGSAARDPRCELSGVYLYGKQPHLELFGPEASGDSAEAFSLKAAEDSRQNPLTRALRRLPEEKGGFGVEWSRYRAFARAQGLILRTGY